MKYLFLAILTSCNTYIGVIVSNDEFTQTSEAKINESHYIVVRGYYDVGDTILINKTDLRVLR